jgi:RHS repeat-associated protein
MVFQRFQLNRTTTPAPWHRPFLWLLLTLLTEGLFGYSAFAAPPVVSITAPADNANFIAPVTITLSVNPVAIGDGNSISQVQYYQGSNLIATATASPFNATWSNVSAGNYSLTATVTDSQGNSTTSTPVNISVINNTPPAISLTVNPVSAAAPATLILNATATDSDGTIAKVEFFGTDTSNSSITTIATLTQAPYNTTWPNLAAGNYSIHAKATDNLGASTTSTAIPVTVAAGTPKVYDIQSDHLNTPRRITDVNNILVWEWKNDESFGNNSPDQNPSALGVFECNLRFPGQYFDQETNLHYNYFRDYDPQTGRYIQSDPIGLNGGINSYSYVEANPIGKSDPLGLQVLPIPGIIPPPVPGFTPRPIPANPDLPLPPKPSPALPHVDPPSVTLCKIAPAACAAIMIPKIVAEKFCKEAPPSNEQCKQNCVKDYDNDYDECGGYRGPYGPHTVRECRARAANRLAICLRNCDGKGN